MASAKLLRFEQVSMCPGPGKLQFIFCNPIEKKPIRIDVGVSPPCPLTFDTPRLKAPTRLSLSHTMCVTAVALPKKIARIDWIGS
jgi:hypothetical protein